MQELQDQIILWIGDYTPQLIGAIVILVLGKWLANVLRKLVHKVMSKRQIEGTVVSFVSNLSYVAMMTFVILSSITRLGIPTTSFVAVIGAAGLAIGLAFQSSLSNFAAGFLLVVFQPFKKGDFIEGAGTMGIVDEIQIFTTRLTTPDNKLIIIPNSKLMGDNITNFSANDTRRVDFKFGVSYADDIKKVKEVLNRIVAEDKRVLKDPAPMVAVGELGDSSVNFVVRVWVVKADYWDVFFATMEKVKLTFDAEGISIPFPQRDIHLYQEK